MEREIENSAEISANTIEPIEKKSRNCAFDIARIVAMFLIVCSHFLGHGGFIRNMTGANFVFGRILTSLFNPSVNLFVLIGAYFTCTSKKLKWQRLAKLYAQVWIYGMTLFVVFLCIQGVESFSVEWLLSSIFPVVCGKYWFFSAYIFMMLVSPLLNIVIERIKKKDAPGNMRRVDRSRYTCRRRSHSPATCHGRRLQRHMVRYAVFYCRFHKKIRRDRSKKWIFIPILAYIATLVAGYFFNTAQCSIVRSTPAIILLIALKDVKTNSARLSKFVTGLSATMFGVYLIHDSNEMRAYMYRNIFHVDTFYDSKYSFLIMLGFAAATFAVCIAIEEIRLLIDKPLSKVVEKYFLKLKDKMQKKNTNTEATE